MSAASGQNVTVVASSANGTAVSGTDYTAITPQTLTFTPGQTSKTVTVVVQGGWVITTPSTCHRRARLGGPAMRPSRLPRLEAG